MLTTAAQSVGTALGMLARKVGVAAAPAIPRTPAKRNGAPKTKTVAKGKRSVTTKKPK